MTKSNSSPNPNKKISLSVQPRKVVGRKVKTLRRQGFIPANIFGKKIKSANIQVNHDEFKKIYDTAGETNIVYINLTGETKERPVLITNIHSNPVTGSFLHIDFHQIDLSQKVTASIPLTLVGTAPAEDEKGAVIVQVLNEIEIEALPTDLPDALEVDLSSLKEFGDSVSVKDIKIDSSKIEIKTDLEQQIVQAQEPKEEETTAPTESETPVEAEAKPETPAETKSE